MTGRVLSSAGLRVRVEPLWGGTPFNNHLMAVPIATYEVMLSLFGEDKGWDWLRKLAANTGHFTARSRDVPTVVAKGEFAAGFAVPSYMAFEEKLAGFDLKFVAPKNSFVTPEPMAILLMIIFSFFAAAACGLLIRLRRKSSHCRCVRWKSLSPGTSRP